MLNVNERKILMPSTATRDRDKGVNRIKRHRNHRTERRSSSRFIAVIRPVGGTGVNKRSQ